MGLVRASLFFFLQPAAQEEGIENRTQEANKVHLNIEMAGPFFPCPYKELLLDPGRVSSLGAAPIAPSRTGSRTDGAQRRAAAHTNTQRPSTVSSCALWWRHRLHAPLIAAVSRKEDDCMEIPRPVGGGGGSELVTVDAVRPRGSQCLKLRWNACRAPG